MSTGKSRGGDRDNLSSRENASVLIIKFPKTPSSFLPSAYSIFLRTIYILSGASDLNHANGNEGAQVRSIYN